jgi:stage II sporulation protein AA (anti-sigma F factor antagonist)
MEIQTIRNGRMMVVSVSGRLDGVTGPQYQTQMRELIESGTNRIVIDLSELNYISSAGLSKLVITANLLKEKKGQFCLSNIHGNVGSVFEMCGIGKMLKIYPTVADALAALAAVDE